MEWKPIESAPKDGTPVWGYWYFDEHPEGKGTAFQGVLHWGPCCYAGCETWCSDYDGSFQRGIITHWMPLPPPPAG